MRVDVSAHAPLQEKLAERQTGVTAAVAVPGIAATNFPEGMKRSGSITRCLVNVYFRIAGTQSAEDGTMPLLECICRPGLPAPAFYGPQHKGWVGWLLQDGVFGPPVLKEIEPVCKSVEGQELLWRLSEEATGVSLARKPSAPAAVAAK